MKHNLIRVSTRTAGAVLLGAVALATGTVTASAGSGGVSGPAFYIDHVLYRTVGTPTDLSNTGAPDHSFDTLYSFGALQKSVATAAPGDPDFNGGRWQVHAVSLTGTYAAALAA